MYRQGTPEFAHHVATFGPQSKFGYKDFIPQFKAERFSAAEWARLFKDAGAKFVVPVAEHHDGFPMYDCSLTEWSAAKMGPKRDIVGELSRAVPAEGLVFGLSSHRAEHWWFFDGGNGVRLRREGPALRRLLRPRAAAEEGRGQERAAHEGVPRRLARAHRRARRQVPPAARLVRLVDRAAGLRALPAALRRLLLQPRRASGSKGVAINYKNASFPAKAAVFDVERGQLPGIRPEFWQTDTSISKNSWGYVAKQDYKTAGAIVGRPRRHRQQERRPAAQHRPAAGRHDPRAGAGDPARDRAVAEGERRGDLRHPPVGRVRRGADRGRGRQLQRHEAPGVHRRRTSASRRSRAPSTRSRSRGRGRRSP